MIANANETHSKWIFYIIPLLFLQWNGVLDFMDMPIKHIMMIACIMCLFIPIVCKSSWTHEYKPVIHSAIILYIISLIYQIINGGFRAFALKEFYFLIAPLMFAISCYHSLRRKDVEKLMNFIFICSSLIYITNLLNHGVFDFSAFKEMFNPTNLFVESVSSMDSESDSSVLFMLFYVYYEYKGGNSKKKWLSFVLCFLGYKRLAILYLFLMFILFRFIQRGRGISKTVIISTIVFFCVLPSLIYMMCTDEFADWFYMQTGVDFNEFTMTRFFIINTVIDENLTNYGLGTVTDFLEIRGEQGQLNMHNDILRIFMETSLVGTIAFTWSYFRIVKNNFYSYMVMLFMFVEMFGAHFLGPGSTIFWILAYLVIFYFNSSKPSLQNVR